MVKQALVAGATGLVGNSFVRQALAAGIEITTVGRRTTGLVEREIQTDFTTLSDLPAADVAVCALGTTLAAAGSRSAFRAVDYDAVLAFANAARTAGVEHFMLVSAVGANARAKVFYSRVKGEAERDLQALGFARLDIAQPGLLIGARTERRPVEAFLQRVDPLLSPALFGPLARYAGVPVDTVAAALVTLMDRDATGVFRHENRALRALADSG